jgi:hypothetical protein
MPSMTIEDPAAALLARAGEWVGLGFLAQPLGVFGTAPLGAWAARRRLLDEPERHRSLLVRTAVAGIAAAVLLGLPMALLAAQL